ncbi:hypothetical protein ACFXOD_35565 [Streptomyces sp. NPDC059161]|uniref:hypothetical protein n=1 Tax=Streptomyces sp. NPDC059161 TaxID=3346749 RepID=UPI0036CF64CA
MPSLVQQLSAHRDLGALRMVLECPFLTTALREGPGGLAVFLCPAHSEGLPAWPGVVTHADSGSMSCGVVLDFRSAEQLLQSHADLFS